MQSMNFAVEVMFCFSSLAMRQLKRHLHFISDALKSIHTNKQSPKSGDPAERKRLRSYTRPFFSCPNILEKKRSGSRD